MPSLSNIAKNRPLSGAAKFRSDLAAWNTSFFQTCRRTAWWTINWSRSSAGGSFASGCVVACYVVGFVHPLSARFGTSFPFIAGALIATIMAMLSAAIGAGPIAEGWRRRTTIVCLTVAVWAIALERLNEIAGFGYRSLSLDFLSRPYVQFGMALVTSLLLLGVPIACATRLALGTPSARRGWLLSGAALGLLVAAQIIGPLLGIQWVLWIAAAGSLMIVATRRATEDSTQECPSRSSNVVWQFCGSLAVGVAAAALGRLILQLAPSAESLQWTDWTGFLLGTAIGLAISRGPASERRQLTTAWLLMAGALGAVLPVVSFGILTDWSLAATAGVSQVGWLFLIRSVVVACVFLPLGIAWGSILGLADGNGSRQMVTRSLPALLIGFLIARWLFNRGVDVPTLTAAGSLVLAGLGALLQFRAPGRTSRSPMACAIASVVALVGVSLATRIYSPARAARLLFSTDVFMERHSGTEARLLPFLDDSRLVAAAEGDRGTYSVWKRHGVQYEVRENGIPLGTYCSQSDLCPQYSGQVLAAALPLTLHESPRRALILGLGSGSTVLAALEFPISEVTCVEADGRLVRLLEQTVWPNGASNPGNDNRMHVVQLEPACAVQARSGGYDVIVADTDPATVATGTPYFTREFYAGVSRQLDADGIFAQRFHCVDFGPWPVSSVLATLKSVFGDVAAIEGGGGDLVLLASNSSRGIDRPDLFTRFQTPQSKHTLAQVGWDWSVALNLGAYRDEACDAIAEGAPVNTAANGLFAFHLPQETMRWGAKQKELAEALNPHAGRIAEWPGVEGNDPEFLRRLNDVLMQRELMTAYPDQPWAYRKSVHEELIKHPHSVIADAEDGFDRKLHPVDRRRLEYFSALGHAAQARRPSLETLRQIEEFAEPYDPVLTYFVHHELSPLYARAETPDSAAQIRHRLYTVYYGDARDRSIRDVVEALQLLAANPQIFPDSERWDHTNALLQFLKLRWNNRGLGKPKSAQIVLNDLDRTIGAAESTFAEMEKLRRLVGISETDWLARREVIERALVRPLRSYQSELMPDYLKEIQPAKTAAKQPAASTKQNAN
jgi:Spermine/spermidine synthase domain